MERCWRFVYDGDRSCRWGWQLLDGMRVKIESLAAFATLDGCIEHARESGFAFDQRYDIVYGRTPVST
jgi:hypothetical protein